MSEKCGCKIIVVPPKEDLTIFDNFVISFCSLHAAAEKMRDALVELLKGCEHEGEPKPDGTETTSEDGYSISCGACDRAGESRKAAAEAALAAAQGQAANQERAK